jgi:hypothetical protein
VSRNPRPHQQLCSRCLLLCAAVLLPHTSSDHLAGGAHPAALSLLLPCFLRHLLLLLLLLLHMRRPWQKFTPTAALVGTAAMHATAADPIAEDVVSAASEIWHRHLCWQELRVAAAIAAKHVRADQSSGAGCCVGRMPKRFLQVMRSLLNLSSGEKRAGCADLVGVPSGPIFCTHKHGKARISMDKAKHRRLLCLLGSYQGVLHLCEGPNTSQECNTICLRA